MVVVVVVAVVVVVEVVVVVVARVVLAIRTLQAISDECYRPAIAKQEIRITGSGLYC